ncbi:MAG: hypothetical protein ACR2FV_03300 [Ornithinimicrobium sp.]|uniref:hypothetical protein n=1 Tax=Ornithinimicrobium sp. TaxID=1977084 RepID=UPI003D9BF4B2
MAQATQAIELTFARAVRPWQLLLEIAGTEGIPLTAAGWMRPSVVQEVYDELGMAREWMGKGNREDQTLPVLLLRESAQRAGRRASGDDEALWEHLAARVLPSRPGFERDASVLWLLGVSADGDPEAVPGKQLADWLTALGWRSAVGAVVQPVYLPEATRDVSDVVARIAGRKGRQSVDPVVARAFARCALLVEDD